MDSFDMESVTALYYAPEYKGRLKIEAGAKPAVSVKLKSADDVVGEAISFIRAYKNTNKAVNK